MSTQITPPPDSGDEALTPESARNLLFRSLTSRTVDWRSDGTAVVPCPIRDDAASAHTAIWSPGQGVICSECAPVKVEAINEAMSSLPLEQWMCSGLRTDPSILGELNRSERSIYASWLGAGTATEEERDAGAALAGVKLGLDHGQIIAFLCEGRERRLAKAFPHYEAAAAVVDAATKLASMPADQLSALQWLNLAAADFENRPAILAAVSALLQLTPPITQITKIGGDSPAFFFRLGERSVKAGDVTVLLRADRFRNFIAGQTSGMPAKVNKADWHNVACALLLATEELSTGDAGTFTGEIKAAIADYLETNRPSAKDWQARAKQRQPFLNDGYVYISLDELRHELVASGDQARIDARQLAQTLRHLGFESQPVDVSRAGDRTHRRYWRILEASLAALIDVDRRTNAQQDSTT